MGGNSGKAVCALVEASTEKAKAMRMPTRGLLLLFVVVGLAATVEGLPLAGDAEVTVLLDDAPASQVDPREEKLLEKAKAVSKMPSGAEKEDKKAEVLLAAKKLEKVQKK